MANGNILSLIAQPQVANVVGQFGAGQETGRINRLRTQAQEVGQLPAGQQQNEALRRLGTEAPEIATKINELFAGLDQQSITSAAFDIAGALSVGGEQQTALLRGALPKVASNGLFTTQIQEMLKLPQEQRDERLINAVQTFQGLGILPGAEAATAGQREFASLTKDLSPEDELKARRIKLRLDPGAVGSSVQTIVNLGTSEAIAQVESTIAEGKEGGQLKAKRRFMPEITRLVKLAEKSAAERGDVLTDLSRADAALPGLLESVGQLKSLAVIATSTLGGRAFDTVVRESGFGATKGADARAKFISIVNNQVLPLLKPTFGAAFTVAEGDSLRATMGDPNLSPSEKISQLEAFIEQKARNIQGQQRQLGQAVTPTEQLVPQQQQQPAAQPINLQTISKSDLTSMTDEQLRALAGGQ